MTQFDLVNQLITNSSPEAIKSLKNIFRLNEDGGDNSKSKSESLLDLIIKYKGEADEKALCKKVYGCCDDKSLKALAKLIIRLKDKIYENALLDKNLFQVESFSELRIVKSELQKSLLLCNVLEVLANKEEIEKICDKVIIKGKEYELYNELLQAYEIKYNLVSTNNNKQQLNDLDKEMVIYDRSRISLFKAKKNYNELLIDINLKTFSNNSDKLQQIIVELEHEYRYTQSANIMYYLHLYSIHYFQNIEDYSKSGEHCSLLINLIKNNKAVYLHQRLGMAYMHLAKNDLLSYALSSALVNVGIAEDYCRGNSVYMFKAKEIKFLAFYYAGNIIESNKVIDELSNISEDLTSIERGKCSFYKAVITFLLEDTKTVNRFLNEISDIEKDKDGWNIGIRILSILNLLKSQKFEIVESQVESLRKHIERSEKTDEVSQRNRLIFRILVELSRSSFNYKKVYEDQKESFTLLSSHSGQYKWSIKSPELIRFHDWFKAKANNEAYELKIGIITDKIKQQIN